MRNEDNGETEHGPDELEKLLEKLMDEENAERENQTEAAREEDAEAGLDMQRQNMRTQQSEEEKGGKRKREEERAEQERAG